MYSLFLRIHPDIPEVTVDCCDNVLLTNGAMPELNGIYSNTGTLNGRHYYVKENGMCFLYFSSDRSRWVVDEITPERSTAVVENSFCALEHLYWEINGSLIDISDSTSCYDEFLTGGYETTHISGWDVRYDDGTFDLYPALFDALSEDLSWLTTVISLDDRAKLNDLRIYINKDGRFAGSSDNIDDSPMVFHWWSVLLHQNGNMAEKQSHIEFNNVRSRLVQETFHGEIRMKRISISVYSY